MDSSAVSITAGDVFRGASDRLSANQRTVLTYLAVFIPLTALSGWLDQMLGLGGGGTDFDSFGYSRDNGLIGMLVLIASVLAQCWLFGQMLGKRDLSSRYLGFFGMAILTFLGVGVATVFLIVPGIFLGARWLMAPAIYVDQGRDVFDALSESWNRTRGNTRHVMLALFVAVVLLVVVSGVLLGALTALLSGLGPLAYLAEAVVGEVATVVLVAMSVATYSLLSGQGEELATVFE